MNEIMMGHHEIGGFLHTPITETLQLLRNCASGCPDGGFVAEFGVGDGHSTRAIRDFSGSRRMFGFDSFKGLPKDWCMSGSLTWPAGTFGRNGNPPVIKDVDWVIGEFSETIPFFLEAIPDLMASFISIDCDLYESAKTVLNLMNNRIWSGTIIYFDEICDWGGARDRYPNWPSGEWKALCEWIDEKGRRVKPIERNNRYGAAVEVTS